MNFASHGVINVGTAVTLAAPLGHSSPLLLRPAGIIPFALLQLTASWDRDCAHLFLGGDPQTGTALTRTYVHSLHDESFLLRCGWALDCCVRRKVRAKKTRNTSNTLQTRSSCMHNIP